MNNIKKLILIDLDGVLNTYNGNYNENYIPIVKNGALECIQTLSKTYRIKIFTTRNKVITKKWLNQNGLKDYIENITNIKEPCFLFIDDRCINFNGNYNDLIEQINNFKVWYKT